MRSETKINKQHAPPLGQNTRGIMGRISPQPSDPTDNCDSSRVTGLEASEFEVKKLIGKGGFGKVYHVVQRSTGEEFALKVINKKRMEEKGTIQRVVSEIEIHLQLEHSSIVKLHDFFEDQTHIFMVLELCSSANLYKRLREAKHFKEDEARRYFIQIVEGLSYLHSHGIVHRDLKLSNLLLSRDGSIKIADFGLATRITEDNVDEQRTVCGTPNYAAPEVCGEIVSHESDKVIESTAKARPGYGVQADVWSLGCLLYSMLVGKPPFPKQQLRNLKPVSQLNFELAFPSHLSSSARDIISALLQVVPAERPRSIDICEMFQFCGAKPKTLAISSTTSVQQNTFVSVPAKSSTGFRSLVSPSSSTKTLSPPSLDLPIISPGPFRNIQETFGHLVIQFLHDGSILSESKQTGLTMVISNNEGNDVSESNQVVRDMSEGTHHEITIQFHKCPNQCGGYADVVKPGAKRTGCSGCLRRFDRNQLPNKLLEFYLHTHKCAEALKASAPRVALELPEGVCTLRGSGSKQELHVHWNEPVWKRAKYKLIAGEIVVEEETGKCVYNCELGEVRWLSGLYTEEREQSVLKTVDTMAEIAFHCVAVLVDYEKTIIDLIASGKANSIPLPCVLRKENDSTIQDSTSTLSQASGTVVAPIDPFVRELVSEMTQTKLTCVSSNQSNKDHAGQQLNGALRNGNLDVQSTKSENLSLQQLTPTTVHHIDTSLHQPSTEILHEECQHSKSEQIEKQLEQHEATDTGTSEPKQVEVTGVGVGIQKSSGEVEVCLEDGTHVLVRLDGSCIVFQSSDEAKAEPIILMPFAKIPSSLLLTFKQTMLIVSDLRSALQ